VLRLRNRLLPLVSLNGLLRLSAQDNDSEDTYIVVVAVGPTTLGIIVDRVFDTEEIVVKPVAPIMRHITMFSGNTILGDGSIIMILDPNGIARATGVGVGGESPGETKTLVIESETSERVAMLLFRAGSSAPKAVPLGLIARLENFPRERIERSAHNLVVQYRGRLMPLIAMPGVDLTTSSQAVLVFVENDRAMGLMVDEIVDVIEDRLEIELAHGDPGLLGTAVIADQATDVIDTGYWVLQAWADWFGKSSGSGREKRRQRLLLIEDNNFFRQMVTPALSAAGYDVTSVESATRALQLRDGGVKFDVIVSDVEMPEMNGIDFVRLARASGAWSELPLIALSGTVSPEAVEEARSAGFTDYVGKSDRDALIASLRQCLSQPITA
jgi:two-component system chemotaxis sensor kinase CheA